MMKSYKEIENTQIKKIDWILQCLDERWEIAIKDIKQQLKYIYISKHHPKPFPAHLKLTPYLAIYISDLIPEDEHDDLINDITIEQSGTIH